jgi:hypothetical protein
MHDPAAISDSHFSAPWCRNCGASLLAAFCGSCGQKRAERFRWRHLGTEAWTSWRLFELEWVRSACRLAVGPGKVARQYVLGVRKRHVHPLKLLLVAIGLLLLVLGRSGYLVAGRTELSQAMDLVQAWGKWSFSLGIFAVLASSLCVFRRRLGYNLTEHLVLAVYVQFLLIAVNLVNLLPVLVWNTPQFLAAHRAAAGLYMVVVEAAVVGLAFQQFFLVDSRRQAHLLALAMALFVVADWLLLRAYGRLVARMVMAQLG